MQHQILPGVVAQGVDDAVQLFAVGDLEDQLAGLPRLPFEQLRLGLAVKPQTEGLVEQLGQARGKVGVLCDDAHLRGTESVAIEQDAVGLRQGAASPLNGDLAQFVFGIE